MGELFRRFWLPVALARELAGPDCPPVRVQVMNEQLVAFRDTQGRVGLVDAYCPHLGAPLFFGRNEECGLRCIYHGWKFDIDGRCVDLPNAPEGERLKRKIRLKSYPCVEAGDLLWAYLGPPKRKPPFPQFDWLGLPDSHRYLLKFRTECNYLQAMEGDYDWSHAGFLHSTLEGAQVPNPLNPGWVDAVAPNFRGDAPPTEPFPRAVGPRRVLRQLYEELRNTPAAVLAVGASETAGGSSTALVTPLWMMPVFCTAGIAGKNIYAASIRVPIDNRSLMCYRLRWSYEPIPERELEEYRHGGFVYPILVPGTLTCRENRGNDYSIDRELQRRTSYSGIGTFPIQDMAMVEDQRGPIADRTKEHLTSSDRAIIAVRKRLLGAAKALANGQEPEAPWHPEEYRYHRKLIVLPRASAGRAIERAMREAVLPETRLRKGAESANRP
jgi:phenylpropionate dioxygenase-like ring-hydroxylating dioxygenase large terminal subunit